MKIIIFLLLFTLLWYLAFSFKKFRKAANENNSYGSSNGDSASIDSSSDCSSFDGGDCGGGDGGD